MEIRAIRAIPYEIPYGRPVRFASGEVTVAADVLVEVETDEGIVGVAEALPRPYTYGESQVSIVHAVRDWFDPWLRGVDPFRRSRVQQVLNRVRGNNSAKGAVDIAIWDVIGQATGRSVTSLLGGYADDVAVSHMLGFDAVGAMVEEALAARSAYGITAFKVKVGREVAEDVSAVTALRDALGDDVLLYLDGNQGWSADQTLQAMCALEGVGVQVLEEPNPADARLDRLRVLRRSTVPVLGDESCTTLGDAARHLLAGTADMVSIKVCRTGFTESQRLLGLLDGLGAGVIVGSQVDGALGAVASTVFAASFASTSAAPAEVSNFLNIKDHLVAEPPTIVDGRMPAPERPGLGVSIDPAAVDRYRTDG